MAGRVVVGVDGSAGSARALAWAVEEAAVRGEPVEAVRVWSYLGQGDGVDRDAGFDPAFGEAEALAEVRRVVEAVDVADVAPRVVCDLPVPGLVRAAEGASLLVLGSRERGRFHDLVLGAVGDRLAQVSPVPVAVVPVAAPVRGGRVVVGVDGSARAAVALAWAAAEAARREAGLVLVHAARSEPALVPRGRSRTDGARRARATAALEADDVEAAVAAAGGGLDVERRLVRATPAAALLDAAEGAGLVVVGSRGLGRVFGSLLGSTSRQVLHATPVPAVVVPAPPDLAA